MFDEFRLGVFQRGMMRVKDLQRNSGSPGREKVRCVSNTSTEKIIFIFFRDIALAAMNFMIGKSCSRDLSGTAPVSKSQTGEYWIFDSDSSDNKQVLTVVRSHQNRQQSSWFCIFSQVTFAAVMLETFQNKIMSRNNMVFL
jgi:hypothetical protein